MKSLRFGLVIGLLFAFGCDSMEESSESDLTNLPAGQTLDESSVDDWVGIENSTNLDSGGDSEVVVNMEVPTNNGYEYGWYNQGIGKIIVTDLVGSLSQVEIEPTARIEATGWGSETAFDVKIVAESSAGDVMIMLFYYGDIESPDPFDFTYESHHENWTDYPAEMDEWVGGCAAPGGNPVFDEWPIETEPRLADVQVGPIDVHTGHRTVDFRIEFDSYVDPNVRTELKTEVVEGSFIMTPAW